MAQVFASEIDLETCTAECRHPEVILPLLRRSLDAGGARAVADLFTTLGDPSRARILHLLAVTEDELRVRQHILDATGVMDGHDIHAWTISSDMNVVWIERVLRP